MRAARIRRVLWAILIANWAVAAAKLVLGALAGSAALVADGLHSVVDGGSNVLGLVAMWIAGRPPDANHPYGHEKFEALASLGIGAMIGVSLFELGRNALHALTRGTRPEVSNLTLTVTLATLLINVAVTVAERREGKRLQSTILVADAQHTLSDVGVSISVLASLVLSKLGVPHIDGLVCLAVLGFVAWAGWRVVGQAVAPLADQARLDPAQVRERCNAIPGVIDARAVRSRGTIDAVRVDLTVEVDPLESVAGGHAIASEVESAICSAFPSVTDVVVHVEPARGVNGAGK